MENTKEFLQEVANVEKVLGQSNPPYSLQSTCGVIDGMFLIDEVNRVKSKRHLDIGTFIGFSTFLVARFTDVEEIVTIDPDIASNSGFGKITPHPQKYAREFLQKVLPPKRYSNIIFIKGKFPEVKPEGSFDSVFIDATKRKYDVKDRLAAVEDISLVVHHDMFFSTVREGWKEYFGDKSFNESMSGGARSIWKT